MPDTDLVNPDAQDGVQSAREEGTAADKLARTLREMSRPEEDAGELGLMLSTVAMGIESAIGPHLDGFQTSGELDDFILAITRFLATHRSDSLGVLAVVELPRRPEGQILPAGTRLHLLDEAIAAAETAESPL